MQAEMIGNHVPSGEPWLDSQVAALREYNGKRGAKQIREMLRP